MKFSIRQSQRAKGEGFWVSPDNHIYKLPDGQSHAEWLMKHQNTIMHYDSSIKENDPDIFEKVFYKGWARIRIEFDSSDNSQWIASVSALDPEIVSTLPEEIKDVIMTASRLEFIEMPSGVTSLYDKEDMEGLLHRKRYASFIKIKYAILNPAWKRYPYEKDLNTWYKLMNLIQNEFKFNTQDFFDIYKKQINEFYDSYVRTKSGGSVDPNRSIRQKFLILSKGTMQELERAVAEDDEIRDRQWEENKLKDESLDARLEREKSEYESRNASIRMSKRDERLSGGLAEGIPDSAFDSEQLAAGTEIELEHTNDKEFAKEIAKDHLTEDKDYYVKLKKYVEASNLFNYKNERKIK